MISRRIAERKIADGAHELFELACDAAALALVIAVVRTRRELVHQQFTLAGDENLDAEQALDAQPRDDRRSQRLSARFQFRRHAGGQHAPREDLIFMMIARRGIAANFARRIARGHDADFAIQVQRLLGDCRLRADALATPWQSLLQWRALSSPMRA